MNAPVPALQLNMADLPARRSATGLVVWLTGLPGSGKTTLAEGLAANLRANGRHCVVLDGDQLRKGLCADLGFSVADRSENIRRVAEVARLFYDQGFVVIVALVSPLQSARDSARQRFPAGDFLEVYCACGVAECQARDPKGMYHQARLGQLSYFTGIHAPYEAPLHAELILNTDQEPLTGSLDKLQREVREVMQRKSL